MFSPKKKSEQNCIGYDMIFHIKFLHMLPIKPYDWAMVDLWQTGVVNWSLI